MKKKILDSNRQGQAKLSRFFIEDVGWVDKSQAIRLCKEEKIDAVLCKTKSGDEYLRANPDKKKDNNFSDMAKEKPHLHFNGKKLCFINEQTNEKKCWPAVSGAEGYQNKEHQKTVNKGPIPEGKYKVQQNQYQKMPSRSLIKRILGEFGRTAWPGNESSWGKNRIWLYPYKSTNVFNRSGFSIHGGTYPGSRGCVDLTKYMPNFVEFFLEYGENLDLIVKYE